MLTAEGILMILGLSFYLKIMKVNKNEKMWIIFFLVQNTQIKNYVYEVLVLSR